MKKVLVIGAGNVGAHIINHGITKHIGAEFFLLDLNQELEAAQILDLKDTLLFSHHARVTGINFDDERLKDMDIIVITAGANQAPGETRCDLLQKNTSILQSIAGQLGELKPGAIVVLVTNPVDILTQAAQQIFKLPANQIFGTGTLLDSARLRWRLADKMEINVNHVHGYVLGEHGDSEFVAWSSIRPEIDLTEAEKTVIAEDVKKSAYNIIAGKGATYFGIGAATTKLLNAIINNTKELLPVSTPYPFIANERLIKTPIGVPAVIGATGILRTPEIKLSTEELKQLQASAEKLQQLFESCPIK